MEKPVIITLRNGLKIGNFSSPHTFEFVDGTILPAVSNEEAERLKIDFRENIIKDTIQVGFGDKRQRLDTQSHSTHVVIDNIELSFGLTDKVVGMIEAWESLHGNAEVDIVLIPLPMLTAMKAIGKAYKSGDYQMTRNQLLDSPFRCIRVENRTDRKISDRKFCV